MNWAKEVRKNFKGFQTYYLLVISIILLTIAIQSIVQYSLNKQSKTAMIVNLAAQQRTLVQKLLNEMYACREGSCDYADLKLTVRKLVQMDHFLKYGNSELGIDPMDNKEIMADFEELYPQVEWFEENISSYEDATKIPLSQLEARVDLFHSMMDRIVLKLQKKSEQDIRTMMIIEIELAILSVFIVLFEIFFIVNPIINRLLMQRQKLSEIAWHQSHVFEKHYKNIADLEYVLRVEKNPERREEIYAFIQEELDHLKKVSHTVSEAVSKATEEDVTPYERAMGKITDWSRQWLFEKKVGPGILDKITRDPIREEQD